MMKEGIIIGMTGVLIVFMGIILASYQFFNWINIIEGVVLIVVGIPIFLLGKEWKYLEDMGDI